MPSSSDFFSTSPAPLRADRSFEKASPRGPSTRRPSPPPFPAGKALGQIIKQLRLPLRHLRREHIVSARDPVNGFLFLQRLQSDLRLRIDLSVWSKANFFRVRGGGERYAGGGFEPGLSKVSKHDFPKEGVRLLTGFMDHQGSLTQLDLRP